MLGLRLVWPRTSLPVLQQDLSARKTHFQSTKTDLEIEHANSEPRVPPNPRLRDFSRPQVTALASPVLSEQVNAEAKLTTATVDGCRHI